MEKNKIILKKYTPIVIVILYLLFTEIFFYVGPIKWGTVNNSKLLLFLFIYKLMLLFGFWFGYKLKIKKHNVDYSVDQKMDYNSIKKILKVMVIISIFSNIIFIIFKCDSFSPFEIFNKIIIGFTNPSLNYKEHLSATSSNLYTLYAPIYTLTSTLCYSTLPLIIYFFDKMNKKMKITSVLCMVIEASRWAIVGTNKGIIDIVIITLSIFFLKKIQENKIIDHKQIFKKISSRFVIIVLCVSALSFFFNNINERLLGKNSYILLSLKGATLKQNKFWYRNNKYNSMFIYLQSYLTQGYYGMGLALNESFDSMYGIGCSKVLTEKLKNKLPNSFFERSYIIKDTKYRWSDTVNWHTAYTWIANDISFWGIIIFMFLLGIYFSKVTLYSVNNRSWYFIPLFSSLMLVFFYMPMNNQIASNPYQFVGFLSLNCLWFVRRNK